jgi:hypothetical protein
MPEIDPIGAVHRTFIPRCALFRPGAVTPIVAAQPMGCVEKPRASR